jgi:hypothetical protein
MTYSAHDIEAKLNQLALIMAAREDREIFLPLYQRLEKELENMRSQATDMDRILQRAANLSPGGLAIAA